jgi:hypothetical protein
MLSCRLMTDIATLFVDSSKRFDTIVKFLNMKYYSEDIVRVGVTSGISLDGLWRAGRTDTNNVFVVRVTKL